MTPYHTEVGAGTFNPATLLRSLGPDAVASARTSSRRSGRPTAATARTRSACSTTSSTRCCSSRRPTTCRISTSARCARSGSSPRSTTSGSSRTTGRGRLSGAWGLGWEVWMDGMEITQFTYFQQAGGIDLRRSPRSSRTASSASRCTCKGVRSVYDLEWAHGVTYGDVYHAQRAPVEPLQLRGRRHGRPVRPVRRVRGRVRPLPRRGPRAAGVRPGAEVQPHLQPARRARRDQRHRARRLHLASTRAGGPGAPRHTSRRMPRPTRRPPLPDLLLEVGCEELPSSACREIVEQAPGLVEAALQAHGLERDEVRVSVAPRRFAVSVTGLPERQSGASGALRRAGRPRKRRSTRTAIPRRPPRASPAGRASRSGTWWCGEVATAAGFVFAEIAGDAQPVEALVPDIATRLVGGHPLLEDHALGRRHRPALLAARCAGSSRSSTSAPCRSTCTASPPAT